MTGGQGTARTLQIAMVVLLLVCVAQVTYWVAEEGHYVADQRQARIDVYDSHARAASRMLDAGVEVASIAEVFPCVLVEGTGVRVDPEVLEELDDSCARRSNRYRWEGAFFVVVLFSGMAIVTHALRQHARLVRRQENFIAAVSHELKSPLASLRLSAETLELRRPDPEAAARLVARMVRDVERLEAMVSGTLEAGRIDEGRLDLAVEDFPLEPEVSKLIGQVAGPAAEKGVEIRHHPLPGATARGDRVALQSVLRNLLSNAVKSAGASGGGNVDVRVSGEPAHLRIEVIDDGLGFDPREAPRLFEKFYRSGDEMLRRTHGTGLGLYIARRLVRASGGRIRAESAGPGCGATFRVRWPRGQGGEA